MGKWLWLRIGSEALIAGFGSSLVLFHPAAWDALPSHFALPQSLLLLASISQLFSVPLLLDGALSAWGTAPQETRNTTLGRESNTQLLRANGAPPEPTPSVVEVHDILEPPQHPMRAGCKDVLLAWTFCPAASVLWLLFDVVVLKVFGPLPASVTLVFLILYGFIGAAMLNERYVRPWLRKQSTRPRGNRWYDQPLRPAAVRGMEMERLARQREIEPARTKLEAQRRMRDIAQARLQLAWNVADQSESDLEQVREWILRQRVQFGGNSAQSSGDTDSNCSILDEVIEAVLSPLESAIEKVHSAGELLLFEADSRVDDLARAYTDLNSTSNWNTKWR